MGLHDQVDQQASGNFEGRSASADRPFSLWRHIPRPRGCSTQWSKRLLHAVVQEAAPRSGARGCSAQWCKRLLRAVVQEAAPRSGARGCSAQWCKRLLRAVVPHAAVQKAAPCNGYSPSMMRWMAEAWPVDASQVISAAHILGFPLAASNLPGMPVRNLCSTSSFSTPMMLS